MVQVRRNETLNAGSTCGEDEESALLNIQDVDLVGNEEKVRILTLTLGTKGMISVTTACIIYELYFLYFK